MLLPEVRLQLLLQPTPQAKQLSRLPCPHCRSAHRRCYMSILVTCRMRSTEQQIKVPSSACLLHSTTQQTTFITHAPSRCTLGGALQCIYSASSPGKRLQLGHIYVVDRWDTAICTSDTTWQQHAAGMSVPSAVWQFSAKRFPACIRQPCSCWSTWTPNKWNFTFRYS